MKRPMIRLNRDKLYLAMARKKLDRGDLAKLTELSESTINTVFSRLTCKPKTAGIIADALGVDVTEIIED